MIQKALILQTALIIQKALIIQTALIIHFFVKNISGASKCIFCCNLEGIKLRLFNKKISQERFIEVKNELIGFNWYLNFNNSEELKGKLEWHKANIPAIEKIENKTAYSFMPKDMVDYIKSLPEFNEKIFNKIIN